MKYLLLAFLLINIIPTFSSASDSFGSQIDALFGSNNTQDNSSAQPSNGNACPTGYFWTGKVCAGDGITGQLNSVTCPNGSTPTSFMGGEVKCPIFDSPYATSDNESNHINNKGNRSGPTCDAALETTKSRCKGAELAQQFGPIAAGLLNSFAAMKSSGDINGACNAAKQIQGMSLTANSSVATLCGTQISSCKKACGENLKEDDVNRDDEGIKQCESYKPLVVAAGVQAGSDAAAFAQSSACANATAGKCMGEAAYNDEECQQFCLKPGRQSHPKCQIALSNCANATYAAQNVQYCTCVNNPFSPNCSTTAGNPIPGTNSGSGLNLDDSTAGSDYDMDPFAASGNPANVATPQGSGGGSGGGLGGGSFAIPGEGSGGSGDEPLSKDILTGTGGSGGAAGIFGGSGGYAEGNGSANKGSGSKDADGGLDLRAFLPGGKNDPKRNPASAGYADPTITKANGLTNWQKVTRKMNEKRPELMP